MKKIKLDELFDNKQFLRVFAVAAAVCLWIIVAMTSNDTIRKTITNVPVNLDLQSATLQNLRLNVVDDAPYYVDIEVTGPRAMVGQLTADSPELATTVRVNQVSEKGTYNLPVITALSDEQKSSEITIESYSPSRIQLTLDRFKSQSMEIKTVVRGWSASPSYIYDSEKATPTNVVVTGPEAELEKIAQAQVVWDLEETLESTRAENQPIELVDAQGRVIDLEDSHLTTDIDEAMVTITVLKQTGVPLEVRFKTPPRDFPLEQLQSCMTMSRDYINVAGPQEVVDKLTGIVLGYLDISQLNLDEHSTTFTLALSDIDEGLKSLDDFTSVTVDFDDSDWNTASFNATDIQVVSPPENYVVQPLNSVLYNVEFVGDAKALESMTADDIVVELDLSEREVTLGQQTYPVKISAPGKGMVWAVGEHSVVIQVAEK